MIVNTCWQCGGSARLDPDYRGRHYGKLVCSSCGGFVSWARPPMTPERAASFRMPFGKYQNSTLAEIGAMDLNYLVWVATFLESESVRRAAACHLESIAGPTRGKARA